MSLGEPSPGTSLEPKEQVLSSLVSLAPLVLLSTSPLLPPFLPQVTPRGPGKQQSSQIRSYKLLCERSRGLDIPVRDPGLDHSWLFPPLHFLLLIQAPLSPSLPHHRSSPSPFPPGSGAQATFGSLTEVSGKGSSWAVAVLGASPGPASNFPVPLSNSCPMWAHLSHERDSGQLQHIIPGSTNPGWWGSRLAPTFLAPHPRG